MLGLAVYGKAVVMSLHDQQTVQKLQQVRIHKRVAARALCLCRGVWWIAASEVVKDQLVSIGVPSSRIRTIPAYLEPSAEGPQSPLPQGLEGFIDTHEPVLSVYGWRQDTDDLGRDVYGFDVAVDAAGTLRHERPNLGLVICIPQPDDAARLNDLRQRIRGADLADQVWLQLQALPDATLLWAASDVFLRPTTTDGDSVAVREALAVGTPVVASDSAPRPEDVRVYEWGTSDALAAAVSRALREGSSVAPSRRRDGEVASEASVSAIEDVYLRAQARR